MKRKMTLGEILKVAYFLLSLMAVCVLCECLPLAVVSVLNLAASAALLKTVDIDDLMEDDEL